MRAPPNSAARGILVLFGGLVLAALLQAEGLRKQAEIQPAGFKRDVAITLTRPLVDASRTLHLSTPRHDVQVALGRQNEDVIDTRVFLTLPPHTGPLPHHIPAPHRGVLPVSVKPRFTPARPLRIW